MLPWHEDTAAFLALLALGGICSAFVGGRNRLRLRAYIALFLAAVIWPWPVALFLGPDSYVVRAALYLSAWTLLATALGTTWGLACRRIAAKPARLAATILPSLLVAAFVLERQRVPDAPCAERAVFRIGDLTLAVPRAMGARSVPAEGAPVQAWQGIYSAWPGAKPEVRALCRATSGGRNALTVSHLSIPVSAFSRKQLAVVQLYARPDRLPYPSLGHFDADTVVTALNKGETSGYRCGTATADAKRRYCTLWQPVSPQVLAVSTAVLGLPTANENPVDNAAVVLGTLVASLKPVAR